MAPVGLAAPSRRGGACPRPLEPPVHPKGRRSRSKRRRRACPSPSPSPPHGGEGKSFSLGRTVARDANSLPTEGREEVCVAGAAAIAQQRDARRRWSVQIP